MMKHHIKFKQGCEYVEQQNQYIISLINKMSLEQKIGSLLTLGFCGTLVRPHIYDFIEKYHCGGLRLTPHARTFGNYVDPKSGKTIVSVASETGFKKGVKPPYTTAREYQQTLRELQQIAMQRPLGLPLHYSYDQEGGTSANYNFGGVNLFPKPMGIRATGDSKLAYQVAKAVARQGRSVGFSWIHSPVLDINSDPRNPEIYTRAYSDRVDEVIEYAIEACKGYKEGGLIACGKHFPGRGDSPVDAHFELPIIDVNKKTLLERELLPYKVLIELDLLPSIMIAHSIFPAIDPDHIATVSKKVLTGLLRDEMGYDGVITTDSMTMGAIATRYGVPRACAMALEVGADLVLMKAENQLVDDTFTTIREFVESGRISEADLNRKVYRVLNTKYKYDLFTQGSIVDEDPEAVIRDEKIVFLSKLVAKKSVLVAREQQNSLPIQKDEKALLIEQLNDTPNNAQWHPGVLFKHCIKYTRSLDYQETSYRFDEDDKETIRRRIKDYDTIIITNFYIRGRIVNGDFINELCKEYNDKKIIVISNTPYKLSVPDEAKNVIITFATTPDNIEVTAGVLFGEITPEGEWPIAYNLE